MMESDSSETGACRATATSNRSTHDAGSVAALAGSTNDTLSAAGVGLSRPGAGGRGVSVVWPTPPARIRLRKAARAFSRYPLIGAALSLQEKEEQEEQGDRNANRQQCHAHEAPPALPRD